MPRIDLNCDMGEGFGAWTLGDDGAAMPLVSSVNIACGFHASDPLTMRRTVRLAKRHGVAVGAHPGYRDLVGFGRRHLSLSPEEIGADIVYQIGALLGLCRAEGLPLRHVKVHGALYNLAARDPGTAASVAEAIASVDSGLVMVCQAGSAMTMAARRAGIPFVEEAFADRAYAPDGSLLPRDRPGAVLADADQVARRVLLLAREGKVVASDGSELSVAAGTVCVHGDSPGAVSMLRAIRSLLEAEGVAVAAFEACPD